MSSYLMFLLYISESIEVLYEAVWNSLSDNLFVVCSMIMRRV